MTHHLVIPAKAGIQKRRLTPLCPACMLARSAAVATDKEVPIMADTDERARAAAELASTNALPAAQLRRAFNGEL